jgi:hypothetical protein
MIFEHSEPSHDISNTYHIELQTSHIESKSFQTYPSSTHMHSIHTKNLRIHTTSYSKHTSSCHDQLPSKLTYCHYNHLVIRTCTTYQPSNGNKLHFYRTLQWESQHSCRSEQSSNTIYQSKVSQNLKVIIRNRKASSEFMI